MTTVKIAIKDDLKAQTLLNMLRIMDFVEIQGLQQETNLKNTQFWEAVGEETLREEWDQSENDHWDEFYRQSV